MDHMGFLEVAEEAIAILKRLKELYPDLVSPQVDAVMDNWDNHFQSGIDTREAAAELRQAEDESLSLLASDLIASHQMEDVLQMLSEEFSIDVDYDRLIGLIGKERYTSALRSEFNEMVTNSISVEQIAELWNGMGKPVIGGQRWTAEIVSAI